MRLVVTVFAVSLLCHASTAFVSIVWYRDLANFASFAKKKQDNNNDFSDAIMSEFDISDGRRAKKEAARIPSGATINEFSRVYRAESILAVSKRRDYDISIAASEEERGALARRFSLPDIGALEADLTLRNDSLGGGRQGGYAGQTVEVKGVIRANVTQICVRTNENFDEILEFSMFAVMRPTVGSRDNVGNMDGLSTMGNAGSGKSKKFKKSIRPSTTLQDLAMNELQDFIEEYDLEDDIIEDENIYSGATGQLDVGELVSQMFALKLDPYPKKPGTKPVRLTFKI